MANVIFITYFLLLLTAKLCPGEQGALFDDEQNVVDEDYDDRPKTQHINKDSRPRYTCYSCEGETCQDDISPETCTDAIICWKSRVRETDGTERVQRACTTKSDQASLLCSKTSSKTESTYQMECCQADLCNDGPFPLLGQVTDKDKEVKFTLSILGSIIGVVALIGGIIIFVLAHIIRKKRPLVAKRNKLLVDADNDPAMLHFTSSPTSIANYHPHELRATAAGDSTLREYLDGRSLTSGSGSGLPLLVQRTLAKHVALIECLGSGGGGGGFNGEVWKGVWHGESVAVKIYSTRDEEDWISETEVYSQLLTSRHENILGYVGSDITSGVSCTQLWLVTHYHSLGSLYDHLNRSPHPLTHHQTLNICLGIANGLLYLHTEINGTQGKPSMAHRNLKSKNILVKNNGSCVIAELSQVVTQERLSDDRFDIKRGTKRYLGPEILDDTINYQCLESFSRADIYSLGLIIWEVCRRCISNGVAQDYIAPYADFFPNPTHEPSIDEIRKLVCLDQRRPEIHNRWSSDPTLFGLGKLMRECWHERPAARLPILRVKKTLIKLAGNDSRVHLPLD